MQNRILHSEFARDTLEGLSATPKFLHSQYFYDTRGSLIFEKIMRMPEYYLTGCEFEIFSGQSSQIAQAVASDCKFFELIELGPGDGLKSKILLKALMEQNAGFHYIPVDISTHALEKLVNTLHDEIPQLLVKEQTGDYFQVMHELNERNGVPKVVLFLGSNIGNFLPEQTRDFLEKLSAITVSGDKALIGFDLNKSPETIKQAHDDPHGHTREFNLNHLNRINRELNADFNLEKFIHHAVYHPATGAMESYLISTCAQHVNLGTLEKNIEFQPWECIFMELSKKFDRDEIQSLAWQYGFQVVENFTDERGYFTDSLWVKR